MSAKKRTQASYPSLKAQQEARQREHGAASEMDEVTKASREMIKLPAGMSPEEYKRQVKGSLFQKKK